MLKTIVFATAAMMAPIKCYNGGIMSEEDKQLVYDKLTTYGCDCKLEEDYCMIFVESLYEASATGF